MVDNTAKFHPADRLKQRFSIQAFRYLTNYTTIYIHCLVLLCQRSSTDSRCISGCNGNNVNRARRDISSKTTTTGGAQSYSGYYLLDQGPISYTGDKRNSGKCYVILTSLSGIFYVGRVYMFYLNVSNDCY